MAKDYENSLGHWVKRLYLLSSQEIESMLRPYGLGRTQWYILYHVDAAKQLPQRELQTVLGIESATLTPLVAALVQKGWLGQVRSPDDRRSKILALTDAGTTHFHSLPNPIHRAQRKAFVGLSSGDIESARKVIQQAVQNLEKGRTP